MMNDELDFTLLDSKEITKLAKELLKIANNILKSLNKLDKNNVLSVDEHKFMMSITLSLANNYQINESLSLSEFNDTLKNEFINDSDKYDYLNKNGYIISELANEYKERIAKEKEEKARLRELSKMNNDFAKLISKVSSDEFGIASKTNIANKFNENENIFESFVISFSSATNEMTLLYPRNDFTLVNCTIKKEYLEQIAPFTLANFINYFGDKKIFIDSTYVNQLKSAKTSEITSVKYDSNGLEHNVIIDGVDQLVRFNVIHNIDCDNKYPLISITNKEIIDSGTCDIDVDSDIFVINCNNANRKIHIPNKCILIYLKSDEYSLNYTLFSDGILLLSSSDDNVECKQIFKIIA